MNLQPRITRSDLEQMISDKTVEPKALPLSLLEDITNGFSDEQEIGRGGFAVVYRGMLDNGVFVAVKRLSKAHMFEKEFNREVQCLIKVKHANVIRLIGYCVDLQGKPETYNGQFVMAHEEQKLLCFEYLTHGTLHEHIKDPSCGLDWRKRYKIINGICEGLHYLHQNQIFHLDLKPPNILLDGDMLPKITDFGLSRCINEQQSRITTTNIGGTMGYLAPESIGSHEITYRFDLYSLGVIILEILTGKKGYHSVDNVLKSWSNGLEESQKDIQLKQVQLCVEIGLECTKFNPAERPVSTQHIIDRLHKMESTYGSMGTSMTRSLVPRDFSFSGSSVSLLDQTMSEQMPMALLTARTKIVFFSSRDEAAKPLIAKLAEKVTGLKVLPLEVLIIRDELKMFSNVIMRIATVYLTNEVVKSWIQEVRKMAYHVEDVMDKFSYHVLQLQNEGSLKRLFINQTHYVNVFQQIADDVVDVVKEIQIVRQMHQSLRLSQFVGNLLIQMDSRWSGSIFLAFVEDEDLVGIEGNRKWLTRWLYSEEPENTVITVSGMGGLGKSTLVRNVYEREKNNFHPDAWIVVSQIDTFDGLLRTLLTRIGYTETPWSVGIDKMDEYALKREIKQRLQNRKCLIVLDDVREQDIYIQIHGTFQNLQGGRIVITTRKDHLAQINYPTRHLEIQALSKRDAFDLFCRRAFYDSTGHMCPKYLEEIATSIVDRCHGLPQAIVTIASMLSSRQALYSWKQTYNQIPSVLSNGDHVRAILNLSYHDLPEDLRNCLLYCSLFPRNHPMSRDSLVRIWVAEGFVLSKENNTPEMVAEGILVQLIDRNLLELVENDELGWVNSCYMRDALHDLVRPVAKKEKFASADDNRTLIHMDKDVRRLSLCGWKEDTVLEVKLPSLRTVVSLGLIASSPDIISSILSESNYLTVLELQDSEVTQVPASIGSLLNLRYIGLRRTKVKSLPDSVENLSNLHTLDIKQTKIEKLPPGIFKIKRLHHLLADRYDDEKQTQFPCPIGVKAPEKLSNLRELQTLETVKSSKDLIVQLTRLMQLTSLSIENISAADCANLFATLSNMPLLSSLLLSARDENVALCFESLNPRSGYLQRLIIRGQLAKGTLNCPIFHDHGPHLKYLSLSWCHLGEDPLGMLAPCLPNLTYLRLTNMHSANTLVVSADYFPNLKTLVLNQMIDVSELNIMDGALPCIEGLYIVSLPMLDTLPRGIVSLHSLKKLWLLDLHKDFTRQWYTSGMPQKVLHISEVRV